MTYRETLPDGCPPDDAEEITASLTVYRLVRRNPPTDDDFRSQRAEKPRLVLRNVTECQARGLSVLTDRREAERRSQGGNLQGSMVCEIILSRGAGRILPTGSRSHHTWWPLAGYDILANCRMVGL